MRRTLIFIIVILLLITGFEKIMNYDVFIIKLAKTTLYPKSSIRFLSIITPVIEIIIAFILYFLPNKKIGGILSLGLFTSFTIHNISLYFFTSNYQCACSSIFLNIGFIPHLIINIILIGMSILIVLKSNKPQ